MLNTIDTNHHRITSPGRTIFYSFVAATIILTGIALSNAGTIAADSTSAHQSSWYARLFPTPTSWQGTIHLLPYGGVASATDLLQTTTRRYQLRGVNSLVRDKFVEYRDQKVIVTGQSRYLKNNGGVWVITVNTIRLVNRKVVIASPRPPVKPTNIPSANPSTSANPGAPYISRLEPSSGTINNDVTVFGTNFSPTGNSVYIGNTKVISAVTSTNQSSLRFKFPANPNCPDEPGAVCTAIAVDSGTFSIRVANAGGIKSNAVPFTVISSTETGTISGTVQFQGQTCQKKADGSGVVVPPCSGFYPSYEVLVYNQTGKTVIDRTTTDSNGKYSIRVPAGHYVLYSQNGLDSVLNRVSNPVTVNKNGETQLNLIINTGVK